MDDIDYSLIKDKTLKKLWPNDGEGTGESIMLIKTGIRFTRYKYEVKSTVVMSTHALYILEEKTDQVKTKMFFHELRAIIKSN